MYGGLHVQLASLYCMVWRSAAGTSHGVAESPYSFGDKRRAWSPKAARHKTPQQRPMQIRTGPCRPCRNRGSLQRRRQPMVVRHGRLCCCLFAVAVCVHYTGACLCTPWPRLPKARAVWPRARNHGLAHIHIVVRHYAVQQFALKSPFPSLSRPRYSCGSILINNSAASAFQLAILPLRLFTPSAHSSAAAAISPLTPRSAACCPYHCSKHEQRQLTY